MPYFTSRAKYFHFCSESARLQGKVFLRKSRCGGFGGVERRVSGRVADSLG